MSTTFLRFFVPGEPAPQGSMKGFSPKGTTIVNMTSDNKKTPFWRADVRRFAYDAMNEKDLAIIPSGEPIAIWLDFVVKRITTLPKTKPTPPATKKPDVDKLARAVFDALTGVVYTDDSQVVNVGAQKRIAEIGETPGCRIHVVRLLESDSEEPT